MRTLQFFVWFGVLALFTALLSACGGYSRGDDSGETVIVAEGASASESGAVCASEDDCDGDALNAPCDPDDGDASRYAMPEECDEDGDGYADTPCTSFDDGDGFFGDDERQATGVNCDVCPGMNDPLQEDSDQDGVGDLCALSPDIGLAAAPEGF